MSASVVYKRVRHAAHYEPGAGARGHDLEQWDSVQEWRDPRPECVPPDTEQHSGYLDGQGRQHVLFIRTAPFTPDPLCPICALRGGGAA